MSELVKAIAARAAGVMTDGELAAVTRGLPDCELACMVRLTLLLTSTEVAAPAWD